ncbi:hypothetical protein GQX74_007686 [Glossina fuscipes]|nr:hypothetical protein GQX74_007686 [Glossina fuscipes]
MIYHRKSKAEILALSNAMGRDNFSRACWDCWLFAHCAIAKCVPLPLCWDNKEGLGAAASLCTNGVVWNELNACLYKLRFGIELSHLFLDDATTIGTHISPIILQDFEEPHK